MKGSTLIIMKAKEEESIYLRIRISYFKNKHCGMAVPSWIEGEW